MKHNSRQGGKHFKELDMDYRKLVRETASLDIYIWYNTEFRYLPYFKQISLKHKSVIMSIATRRLAYYIESLIQSIVN